MALNVWTVSSGTTLGTYPEEIAVDIALPVTDDSGVTYSVISGKLPGGTRILGNHIVGNPYIIANNTTYSFCIRATHGSDIADRAFFITITGNNHPVFVDLPGSLPIGLAKQLYVLDSTHINYQIEAFDLNVAAGQTLTYFIASDDGELPKGITLSPSGVLSGFIGPTVKITPLDGSGTYDESFFDRVAYDFANRPSNGFDSYKYDDVFFDFNLANAPPTTLNVNYQFRVTLTDGVNYAQRIFKIFVVGTDQFRADSTSFNGVADGFTSDSTYLRSPVWITDPNLGSYRANNYLTIPIALYDNLDVIFRLEPTNEEVYAVTYQVSNTDNNTGFTFQATLTQNNSIVTNVTNISSLTVGQTITGFNIARGTVISSKTGSTINLSIPALGNSTSTTLTAGGDELTVTNVKGTIQAGQYLTFANYLDGATGTVYKIASVTDLQVNGAFRIKLYSLLELNIPNGVPFYIGTLSKLPVGVDFDPGTGDIYGQLPYQPAITTNYLFTITATRIGDKIEEYLNASKTFNMSVLGNIDSVISWNTPSNLGIVPANYISTLAISASTTVPNAVLIYQLVGGRLPPGLTLNLDGEIIGITNQYYNTFTKALGLTSFDGGHLTLDQNAATIDRVFIATIEARDQFNYSAITQDFKITVSTPNTVAYSNIVAKPFLKLNQRALWKSFINDNSIFTPSSIYRTNDTNFGVQSNLTMLVYAGVETKEAAAYVGAMGLNFKRKRFQFSNIKKAVAIDPNTGTSVYEVVYVQMIDPQETDGKHLPISITSLPGLESDNITADNSVNFFQQTIADLNTNSPFGGPDIPQLTVDSTGYEVSNPKPDTYFPNSITNWQTRLEGVGLTERNYLPLWMRSVPNGQKQQLGYTLSVPLCFCKPGTADDIILNIKYSNFDFKVLDYEIDRFTIDSVTGYQGDKYLVFRNDRITV
jgi:hypothetical protein